MNSRYRGPAIFPSAIETRKRVGVHLDTLAASDAKTTERAPPARKKWMSRLRRLRRRP